MIAEQTDDNYIEDIDACRSAEDTMIPPHAVTGGLLAFYTMTGTMLILREIVHRETNTAILLIFMSQWEYGDLFVDYFSRITAFGFDVACGLWLRIISLSVSGLLTLRQIWFWMLLMPHFFIDRMHIKGHKKSLCNKANSDCLFDSGLPKFRNILNGVKGVNDQVVEQGWTKLNKFSSLKRLAKERFAFALWLTREYHNHALRQKRARNARSKNYWDEPITNFVHIRYFSRTAKIPDDHVHDGELMRRSSFSTMRKYFVEWCLSFTEEKPLMVSRRISRIGRIAKPYRNIFMREGDIGWVRHPLEELLCSPLCVARIEQEIFGSHGSSHASVCAAVTDHIAETLGMHSTALRHHELYIADFVTAVWRKVRAEGTMVCHREASLLPPLHGHEASSAVGPHGRVRE